MKYIIPAMIAILILGACSSTTPTTVPLPAENLQSPSTPATGSMPGFDGQTLLQERCTACHSLARIEGTGKDAEEWQATINRMVEKGAVLTEEEINLLSEFLSTNYP